MNIVMGNSRKYPYHTMDGFHILSPPLVFGLSKMRYLPLQSFNGFRLQINTKTWIAWSIDACIVPCVASVANSFATESVNEISIFEE